jgi:hypothetical protein
MVYYRSSLAIMRDISVVSGDMNVAMTRREATLFEAFLRGSRNYLEFGSGGSTFLAAKHVTDRIISVDSSQEWLAKVNTAVASLPGNKPELTLHYVDIGPTREWGYPVDDLKRSNWPNYSTQIWFSSEAASYADLYLIDGRFRVACFCETLLRAPSGSFILVHDFDGRPAYHVALSLARRVATIDQLSVFVKDEHADLTKAQQVAEDSRFIAE